MNDKDMKLDDLRVPEPSQGLADRIMLVAFATPQRRGHFNLSQWLSDRFDIRLGLTVGLAACLILALGIYLSWPRPSPPENPEVEELEFMMGI